MPGNVHEDLIQGAYASTGTRLTPARNNSTKSTRLLRPHRAYVRKIKIPSAKMILAVYIAKGACQEAGYICRNVARPSRAIMKCPH